MDGQWIKKLANMPTITEEVLLRFIVERVSDIHRNKEQAKKTKSFKAYTYTWACENMQVCKSLTIDSMLIVKAQVLASMNKFYYNVYVGVRDCGEIVGAYCDCGAG